MKKILMLVVALMVIPVSAHAQRHDILGTEIGWNADLDILSDIEVSGFRVRHVSDPQKKVFGTSCTGDTYYEWIEMDGPINPDAPFIIERLIDRIKQNPNRCKNSSGGHVAITVNLNSGGGYMKDGFALAEIFRREQVQTDINDECYSSCAAAFMGGLHRTMFGGGENSDSAKIMFHAPFRYLNRYDISCSTRRETRDLQSFFVSVLGEADGEFLYERTMSYCSNQTGWTLNADAAEIFGITTSN